MFDLPLDPQITLEDTIAFHEVLLGSGAPINEINTLRKHFSAVKGGRLAMAAPEAPKSSFLLPDVPLRTLDALSSGPTSPDHSTVAEVREILAKYDLAPKFPPSVRAFFERNDLPESPGNKSWRPPFLPGSNKAIRHRRAASPQQLNFTGEDEAFRDSVFEILLSSHDLVENARALAQKAGYFVAVDNTCDDWDYADAARYLLDRFHALRAHASPLLPDLRRRSHRHAQTAPRALAAAISNLRWPARWSWPIIPAKCSPCSAPAPTASTATHRRRSHRRSHHRRPRPAFGFDPEQSLAPSTPARCSPPWAIPSSPAPPATTCATCAC